MVQLPGSARVAAAPATRLVELPGRGTTRVWECPGPAGAETLMLIHGVAFTAELNWGLAFAQLAPYFRVIAADLRGHGDGIPLRSRFRLEDCADDIAALAGVLGIRQFVAVGYSMGGMVAQLLPVRHRPLLSGLVLCATVPDVRGSAVEQLTALAIPAVATALTWNPLLHVMGAELVGPALLGPVDDLATAGWARAQLARTSLATAVSAVHAVCEFSSGPWLGQVERTGRRGDHDPGSSGAAQSSAQAGPGDPRGHGAPAGRRSWGVHHRAARVRAHAARSLPVGSARPREQPPAAGGLSRGPPPYQRP